MATSEVEIVNSALVKIGEAPVVSLTEDREQARVASRQYPLKRDELLRRYRWNFAIKRATLAPDATKPAFGYQNRFLMPSTCLRVIGLYDDAELKRNYTATRKSWKVEGRYILSDTDVLRIFYLDRITDPTQFDPMFVEALAWLLAYDIAYALSSGPALIDRALRGFSETIKDAKRADAVEGTPEHIEASEWTDSRWGYGSQVHNRFYNVEP